MLYDTHTQEIDELLSRYADRRSAVLPVLYIAQDTYGTITPEVIHDVAETLDLPYTDVFEVVGFYTLFYDKPFGKWMIQVCDDVPCCYLGAEELLAVLKEKLGVREDEVTSDGMFTVQRVKCLATCQRAPVVQANLSYYYDVTAERAEALLSHLRGRTESLEATSVSGKHAEDYEPDADGTFRQIARRLGPIEAPVEATADVAEVQQAEEQVSAPAKPRKARAKKRVEEEAPIEASPDQTPASAHPDPEKQGQAGAVPAQPPQQEPPEEQPKPDEESTT
jgi:NADH-quinone oxidoreductase subunit E